VQSTINFTNTGGNLGGPASAVLNASNVQALNGGANPQIVFTAAPATTNGIIGGWAVINGADFANYRSTVDPITGAYGVGNLGFSYNGQTPFGGYSANAITAGVAADNISTNANTGDITTRTINSWAYRNSGNTSGTANEIKMRSLDQLVSIGSGGLLINNGAAAVNFLNGRMTAGTAANSSMYVFANTPAQFLNRFENNGGGTMHLVKSGPATVTLRVEPRITFDASYASSGAVDTLGASSTGQAGVPGLVVGMSLAGAAMNVASGSVITQVNTGTRVTFSANATSATGTDADQTFRAPVTQVLGNQTLSTAAATVTVPTGTVVYPGMTVTAAAGSTGALAANTTVLSISGTTVTLSVAPTTAGAASPCLQTRPPLRASCRRSGSTHSESES